jgi:hypothetical protein
MIIYENFDDHPTNNGGLVVDFVSLKLLSKSLIFLHHLYMESFENMNINPVLDIEVYSDIV